MALPPFHMKSGASKPRGKTVSSYGYKKGISNSRMKDFFDVALLARVLDFDGELSEAVHAVQQFVLEPLQSVANGRPFVRSWRAGGPWRVEDDAAL
jgi:hypothetical protein